MAAGLGLAVVVGAGAVWSVGRGDENEVELRPATAAVVAAVRESQVVLIGEIHGWPKEHRFLRALVASAAIRDVVDDVVVEFGNARFQGLVDAYVRGEDVPREELARAWEQTTQGSVWSTPDYAAFFLAVRNQNGRFAPERRLRILLGDPPITTGELTDPHRLDLWVIQRDIHFAHVIQRDVLARGRRALVIAGVGHVLRRPAGLPTLSNLLEGRGDCTPDPAAVAAGIDWCDDLDRVRPVDVHVVVPRATLPGLSRPRRASIIAISGTQLARLPLNEGWTLGQAADSVLLLPR